jgi:antitoxin component YwqK of YwqJK toxin-antitoxin module
VKYIPIISKIKLLSILFASTFLFPISIEAQKIDTIYYDANWIISSCKNYKYYRLYTQIHDLVQVTDYYKNGKIQMTGSYKSIEFKDRTGPFFYYDEKARLTKLTIYEPLNYPDIIQEINNTGITVPPVSNAMYFWAYYYKNGKIQSLGYSSDQCMMQGTWLYFFENGELFNRVNYLNNLENGESLWYFYNLKPYVKGYYIDGQKDGHWEYYDINGKIKKTVRYSNGKKIKTIH